MCASATACMNDFGISGTPTSDALSRTAELVFRLQPEANGVVVGAELIPEQGGLGLVKPHRSGLDIGKGSQPNGGQCVVLRSSGLLDVSQECDGHTLLQDGGTAELWYTLTCRVDPCLSRCRLVCPLLHARLPRLCYHRPRCTARFRDALLMDYVQLFGGLVLLVIASDWLVDGAVDRRSGACLHSSWVSRSLLTEPVCPSSSSAFWQVRKVSPTLP